VRRRPEQLLAHLPVRVRGVRPRERGAQDRAGDVLEPLLAEHLRDVDSFRERELLVRVPDAVAPGEQQVLHEQRAGGVLDARPWRRGRATAAGMPSARRPCQSRTSPSRAVEYASSPATPTRLEPSGHEAVIVRERRIGTEIDPPGKRTTTRAGRRAAWVSAVR